MTHQVMGLRPAVAGCTCRLCRPEPPGRRATGFDLACIDTVRSAGWQVTLVGEGCSCCGDPADPELPAFAYTVGLHHRVGHPELAMSGLPGKLMHSVLNYAAARVVGGHRIEPGDAVEGALGNVALTVDAVSPAGLVDVGIGAFSSWFHRRPVDVVQLVWPTTAGIFAWQPGCPADLDERQPPGWRVASARIGAFAVDPPWPLPIPPDGSAISCVHLRRDGDPVRFVARLPATDGLPETWQFDCGRDHGDGVDELLSEHVAHSVRAAPSVRDIADLAPGEWAYRPDAFSPWERGID